MESSQEASPAPSASSRSLQAIAKARIARKAESSTNSIKEVENEGDRSAVRSSVDSLLERTRSRQASKDDGLPAGPSNLSKLVPGRVKKKKKKREEAERAQKEAEENRGRPAGEQVATSALTSVPSQTRSLSTLGDGEGSLDTFDSEPDSPVATKPDLRSHDSHIGYLTTSSPLIKTVDTSDVPPQPLSQDPDFHHPVYSKSISLPTNSSATNLTGNLSPLHASTFDTRRSSQSSVARSRSRGVSPGAKIKDVLKKGARRKADSPPKSPDPMGDEGRLKNGKIPTIVGQDASFSGNASVVSVPESIDRKSTAPKDVPSIKTTPGTPPNEDPRPATTITPPTPTDNRRGSEGNSPLNRPLSETLTNPNITVSPTGNMISHRRVRSDSATNIPTKLSRSIPPPMTPMAEETKTPGGTVRSSSSGSAGAGFFSSVFSAAQNMTNTLTSSITNPNRSRSSTATNEDSKSIAEEVADSEAPGSIITTPEKKKPLAVDTLGSGELRLSHLGISTESLARPAQLLSEEEKSKSTTAFNRDEAAAMADDASAARAVSAAYNEKPSGEALITESHAPAQRSVSMYAPSIAPEMGEKTPPTGSIYEGADSIRRSGSVRSRVGNRVRRQRNSSSATGNTVGTTIIAPARSPGSQPTSFAVASKKRNREFRQLFKSVPEDDFLIEDYSCALQKEIIIAGRLYISESHICFSSNILGWITTLVISFNEVVSMEKENTAVVFPNAIAIQTLHARHTFRSLLSREATYELLVGIWKLTHPNLKVSGNGTRLDPDAEKVERADPSGSDEVSDMTEGEEVYDEDQEGDDGSGSATENGVGSVTGSLATDDARSTTRKASALGLAAGSAAVPSPIAGENKAAEKAAGASAAVDASFPGPTAHAPTICPDGAAHLDKELQDDIIPAPLGKVYSMIFGPASGGFMARWLVDDMKCSDLNFDDEAKKGISDQNKSRSMSYIKPLYAPIGPKTTTCLVTETVDFFDLEKAVCVTASTQTPDVPSGNVFVTKTHFCFMWAPNNQTRAIMNYKIEWTGKSWLKGPIEKGATDGQTTYCVELLKALKAGIASPRLKAGPVKGKGKAGGRRIKPSTSTSKPDRGASAASKAQSPDWGLLEPVRPLFSPITDIFAPFISSNVVIGFLLFIIVFNYLRSPSASTLSRQPGFQRSAAHTVAYEDLWQREEADLWDWLDQRIGVNTDVLGSDHQASRAQEVAKEAKQAVMQDARMSEREVESTIKSTEEKLERLKRRLSGGGEKQATTDERTAKKAKEL